MLKTRSKPSVQRLSHLAVGSLRFPQMKMSCRRTAAPNGTTMQRKRQGRGHSEGHSCRTSDHLPLTRPPPAHSDTTSINSLSARIHWWLRPRWCLSLRSHSQLISFPFNFVRSPLMSPFHQGGPGSVPAEHGIAAVHHSWQQCLLPEIYIMLPVLLSLCQLTRSLSTEVIAATNAKESNPNPPAVSEEERVFSHRCQHSVGQIHRLMTDSCGCLIYS